jgi:hypothetical protein
MIHFFGLPFLQTKALIMDTSFISQLNWLAIAVAAVAYFMLGALWYGVIFKTAWIRESGVDMNSPRAKKGGGGIMVVTLILEFVTAVGIAILANRIGATGGVISGIKLGLLTGVAFAAIAVWISFMYQMKSNTLMAIDGAYHVLGHIICGAIIFGLG